MASTVSLYPDNSTNANFRAWVSAISTAIGAAGWTATTDTNQINLTTTVAPTAASTVQGYQVWQTADSFTPWFFKIEYGSGSSTYYPCIWVTLGTTNTAGTLGGQLSTRIQLYISANSSTVQQSASFAGGQDWFSLAFSWDNTGYCGVILSIERLKDVNGADTDTGFSLHAVGSGNRYSQLIPTTGTVGAMYTVAQATNNNPGFPMLLPPYGDSSSLIGNSTGIISVHPFRQYHYYAVLGLVGYYCATPDIAAASTFLVNRYTANHTYLALGSQHYISQSIAPAIRYE